MKGETIIVDTREKKPWSFERFGVSVKRETLRSGDYSMLGYQSNGIAIERKSFQDLYGSMTAGRIRFYNELRRLGEFGLAVLIVEADEDAVLRGSNRTMINPGRMLRTLYAWCCAFRIQLHFCNNVHEAETKAYRLMMGWNSARDLKSL